MKKQRFWNTKHQRHVYLTVSHLPGMFVFMGKTWSPKALQALGLVEEPERQPLPAQPTPLVFGNPDTFQGTFCRTQSKGPSPSWGGGGSSGGKVARSPKS